VLSQASGVLNDRERHILEASRLAEIPITLRGLPEEFGVSLESVRLIGMRALEKVQTAVKNGVRGYGGGRRSPRPR
jgi:RNA polymerase sigma-32 factor